LPFFFKLSPADFKYRHLFVGKRFQPYRHSRGNLDSGFFDRWQIFFIGKMGNG